MEIKLGGPEIGALETDALVLLETEGQRRPDLASPLAGLYESGEITGKALELTLVHGVAGFKARRVLVAGSGKSEKLDAALLRKIASAAIRLLRSKGVKSVVFALEGSLAAAANVSSVATGLITRRVGAGSA